MKTVYFVRHAKSSWEDLDLPDLERPLNNRGLRDAPFMALKLKSKEPNIDRLITSPSRRTFVTATYFAVALGMPPEQILVEPNIYEAYPDDILSIIRQLPDQYKTVALFGHNPTWTMLANAFRSEVGSIVNVPTCGIFTVEGDVDHWIDFGQSTGIVTDFFFPKQFFD